MFYRRGPIGLVLLSLAIVLLWIFIGLGIGINPEIVLLVSLFCPWISKKIYLYITTENNKEKIINQKVAEIRKDFLKKKEVRKNIYDLLVSYKLKMVKTIDDSALKEINSEYEIIKAIYEKLIEEYKNEYNLEYHCSECNNPLSGKEKKCPFCGEKTE